MPRGKKKPARDESTPIEEYEHMGKIPLDKPPARLTTVEQFRSSLALATPPTQLDLALAGLWWDAKGDWKRAHATAQQDEGARGAWVHAYLHRKEGDLSNTGFWYRRAGQPVASGSLAAERERILTALLAA